MQKLCKNITIQLAGENLSRDRTGKYKHLNLGTNFDIFIAVSTKSFSFSHSNLPFFYFLITYVVKRFVGRNARNKSFFMRVLYLAVETLKAAIEQTSRNITTSGTNFDIFISVSSKSDWSLKSTFH